MPFLHFYGKFGFQVPYYNNDPSNKEVVFDEKKSPSEVRADLGSDPLRYFEFEFKEVYVNKVTYSDGSEEIDSYKEPLVGKKILVKGLLVDTSPNLQRGRLFACEIRVIDLLKGNLDLPIQSDVFINFRQSFNNEKTKRYSASFQSDITNYSLMNEGMIAKHESRFIDESRQ